MAPDSHEAKVQSTGDGAFFWLLWEDSKKLAFKGGNIHFILITFYSNLIGMQNFDDRFYWLADIKIFYKVHGFIDGYQMLLHK